MPKQKARAFFTLAATPLQDARPRETAQIAQDHLAKIQKSLFGILAIIV
jgi:hypothetical protein